MGTVTHTFAGSSMIYDRATKQQVRVQFEVEIDAAAIIRKLGPRAYANKSKVAKECDGAIVLKVRA